ncbi:hypothetical protein BC835DRAFT_1411617 [Cytidiella melzeri]|nr:hypothetical protein BC835DRAFT_1411617 [Cytidiella melzeri]
MARLHGLFPTNNHDSQAETETGKDSSSQRVHKIKPPPKYLKIRMLTWNMHDSVPKGDLQDLLGIVHDDVKVDTEPGVLPAFPLDTHHPYHLLVVAGQECPSLSGIPMGLGAGFKLKDKERERLKEKDPSKDKEKAERPLLSSRPSEQSREDEDERARRRSRHRSLIRHHSSQGHSHEDVSPANFDSSSQHISTHHQPSGWTYMLEDWYSKGVPTSSTRDAPDVYTPQAGHDTTYLENGPASLSPKAKSTGDLNARLNAMQKGPYELLVKERMMGLYLAVFVHRDVKELVEKTSRSAVTAGLIGGRVGNKGGVAVGALPINTIEEPRTKADVAHEGKVHHRIANFVKIKNEVTVDDFLAADDPRVMAEDLTDRFDFTFVCGDLNFRLDITRLHADWLLSQRDYAQALAFDQLRKVMQTNSAFAGFEEGPIDFPPTFKYDVPRSRLRKKLSQRVSKKISEYGQLHEKLLNEIEEKVHENTQDDTDEEPEADGEAVSLASTVWTTNTRHTADGDDQEEGDEYFANTTQRVNAGTTNIVNEAKVLSSAAAHRAKAKWISLIAKPHSPLRKWHKTKHGQSKDRPQTPLSPSSLAPSPSPLAPILLPQFNAVTLPPTPEQEGMIAFNTQMNDNYLKPSKSTGSSEHVRSSSPQTGKPVSTKTNQSNDKSDEEEEKGGYVYDSSHKQRVPSWYVEDTYTHPFLTVVRCDRILWKSTLEPDPEDEGEDDTVTAPPVPHRSRMGSLLQALRPASIRGRKDSAASVDASVPTVGLLQDSVSSSPASAVDDSGIQYPELPSSPHSYSHRIGLRHSKSTDFLQTRDRPHSFRTRTQWSTEDEPQIRSRRVSLSSNEPSSLTTSNARSQADTTAPPPVPPKDFLPPPAPVTSLWKSLSFLPFLRDGSAHNTPPEMPPRPVTGTLPPPRKGDVVCLGYATLDDRQMRRLEGRSDHRPVIGSYALYI